MTGSSNPRGQEMNPVPGKEFPSSRGEQVVIGCPIDDEIPCIQVGAEVPECFFEMGPSRHEHQDGPGRMELTGEFFEGAAYFNRQSLHSPPEFRDGAGINIICDHGKALAGYGENQIAAEKAETEDTYKAVLSVMGIIRHVTVTHIFVHAFNSKSI